MSHNKLISTLYSQPFQKLSTKSNYPPCRAWKLQPHTHTPNTSWTAIKTGRYTSCNLPAASQQFLCFQFTHSVHLIELVLTSCLHTPHTSIYLRQKMTSIMWLSQDWCLFVYLHFQCLQAYATGRWSNAIAMWRFKNYVFLLRPTPPVDDTSSNATIWILFFYFLFFYPTVFLNNLESVNLLVPKV